MSERMENVERVMGDPHMAEVIRRVKTLVDHFYRDLAFRAPEAVAQHQARLLNQVWSVVEEGRNV